MKEGDLGLLLKYFLSWYEYHLEQRHIQENQDVSQDTVVGDKPAQVIYSPQNDWRQPNTTVSRMHQELRPVTQQYPARRALLAEMFPAMAQRHTAAASLTGFPPH